ncbi:Hypothetical protein (plasmid) [Pseudomonas putida]|nr:Hypothetical protein [Pseudomonas putida]
MNHIAERASGLLSEERQVNVPPTYANPKRLYENQTPVITALTIER